MKDQVKAPNTNTSNETKRYTYTWGFKTLTYLFLILSLAYLVEKLMNFDNYQELIDTWKEVPDSRYGWLILVVVLLPLNWILESGKWKKITQKAENLSWGKSIKSVLAGTSTGFITPNKLGDVFGRLNYISPANRHKGWSLFAISSISQNAAIFVLGLPALFIYLSPKEDVNLIMNSFSFMGIFSLGGLIMLLYLMAPELERLIQWERIRKYTQIIEEYTKKDLILILLWAIARVAVFSLQFFALLQFFGIELTAVEGLIAIPIHYMLVTITPSIAFGEAIVRSSYAVLVMERFTDQSISLAFAGATLWMINMVIPVIIGSALMIQSKSRNS